MRIDQLLVQRGLASTRSQAQRLIAGGVERQQGTDWRRVAKNGDDVPEDAELRLLDDSEARYVSRGGLKLEAALKQVGLAVDGFQCLDVGQSTGGFTDCLLQRGAAQVVGVDVGHDQLHARMRADVRVTCIEGVNAREMTVAALTAAVGAPPLRPLTEPNPLGSPQSRDYSDGFDLIVADVSFISLTKVLPRWPVLLAATGRVLSLVKPQFEVGADNINRGGIVRDVSLYASVETTIRAACVQAGLRVLDYFDSSITGTDGNREFFVYAELA